MLIYAAPAMTSGLRLPPLWLTLAVAAAMQVIAWPAITVDMAVYLVPWFEHIEARGIIGAFAEPFSNYTPPYLYLLALVTPLAAVLPVITVIKLLSLAGTLALALAFRRLLLAVAVPVQDANKASALLLAWPSVVLNAGLLGQCDAIWTAAIIMALAMAAERRHLAMLAWCGVAIAFKAQAAFVAPFFVALAIQRRVLVIWWPVAPLFTALMMVPALLAGWPVSDIAGIYLRQAEWFEALSLNAPNIWAIVQALPLGGTPLVGLAFATAIGTTAAYIARFSVTRMDAPRVLLAVALLAPLITVGLLPRMHERFFFAADVIALALAVTLRDREGWRIAMLVQAGSMLGLMAYLVGLDALAMLGAVCMIAATWLTAKPLIFPAANDNPLMVRTA